MKRVQGPGTAIAVAVTLMVPLVAAGVLVFRASSESPLESAADVEPLVGTVERAERFHEVQVAISVKQGEAQSPVTNASGTVTSLNLARGSKLATGTVIGAVDGAEIVAYASASPLYRDISRGLKGPDVRAAQELLTALGFPTGAADGTAGRATEQAIIAFNKAHGWGDKNPVLSLSSLVWIGTGPLAVGEPAIHLGDVVSPGTKLFASETAAATVAVTETAALPREAEVTLTVGGVTVPYVVGSAAVTDPDAVAAIAAELGTVTDGVGTMRLATAEVVGSVPASAIVSDPTGATCLFPSVDGAPVAVSPVGGTLGTVDLDASLVGQAVLLNPRDVREDLSCGS